MTESASPFTSDIDFDNSGVEALVVYCSDGRFAEQTEQFIHEQLGLIQYDKLVIPGGAGALVDHQPADAEAKTARGHLRFLVEAHQIKRLILIQHDDCGFYQHQLGVSAEDLSARQHEDAITITEALKELNPDLFVDIYIARIEGQKVRFALMEL
jgi:carbonic anhydrase